MSPRLFGLFVLGALFWMPPVSSNGAPLPDYVVPSIDFDVSDLIQVSDSPAGSVAAAATPDGEQFVVVWEEDGFLFAQRFDREGKAVDPAGQHLVIAKDCRENQEGCSFAERWTKAVNPTRPTVSGAFINGDVGYQIVWEAEAYDGPSIYRRTLWAKPVGSPAVELGETTLVTLGKTEAFISESEPDVKCYSPDGEKFSACLLATKQQADCSAPGRPFVCTSLMVRRFFDDFEYPRVQHSRGMLTDIWEPKIAIVDEDHAVAVWLQGLDDREDSRIGVPHFQGLNGILNQEGSVGLGQYFYLKNETQYCHRHAIESTRQVSVDGYFLHLCTQWRDPLWHGESDYAEIQQYEMSPGYREIRGTLITAGLDNGTWPFPATCFLDYLPWPVLHSDPVVGFDDKGGGFLLGFRRWDLLPVSPSNTDWEFGQGGLSLLRPQVGAVPQEYWDKVDCGMGGEAGGFPTYSSAIPGGVLDDGKLRTSINRNALAVARGVGFYFYNFDSPYADSPNYEKSPRGLSGRLVTMH